VCSLNEMYKYVCKFAWVYVCTYLYQVHVCTIVHVRTYTM